MKTRNEPTPTRLVPAERLIAVTSLIAEGAVFTGSFNSAQDLGIKIDGVLNGGINFETGGVIHIGATGVIEKTSLVADFIFIEGKVVGTVTARKALEISGSATLLGDATYEINLDIHPRARIKGKVEYTGDMATNP